MRVIAIASQKGGSGKTTLAGHLAVQAEKAGAGMVALIDADPQGSLADWWNEREAPTPVFVHTSQQRLEQDVESVRELGVDLLIIDTPPAITATISDVIRVSDVVLIPTRPSPHDLRSVGRTVELVEALSKPLIFVVNGATPRARITSEAAIALSIILLAREIVVRERGAESLVHRMPWLVAFVFGLLHGLGFAGALGEIGLRSADVPMSLLFFNLGVEAGQVSFVLVLLAVMGAARASCCCTARSSRTARAGRTGSCD